MNVLHNCVKNCFTLCKYGLYDSIELTYEEDNNEQMDDGEDMCCCNLCYTVRHVILFSTRRLECKYK